MYVSSSLPLADVVTCSDRPEAGLRLPLVRAIEPLRKWSVANSNVRGSVLKDTLSALWLTWAWAGVSYGGRRVVQTV